MKTINRRDFLKTETHLLTAGSPQDMDAWVRHCMAENGDARLQFEYHLDLNQPVENCMQLIHDDEHNPFGYIWVDPLKCIGCKQCISQGVASKAELKDLLLIGCPWDAIQMTPIEKVEQEYGVLEY